MLSRGAMTLSKFLTILHNPFDPVRLSTGHFTSISQSLADVNPSLITSKTCLSVLSEPDELAGNASPLPVEGMIISLRDSGHDSTTKWQLPYILFFSFFEKKKITVRVQRNLECVQFRFSCRTTIIARFEPNSTQDN